MKKLQFGGMQGLAWKGLQPGNDPLFCCAGNIRAGTPPPVHGIANDRVPDMRHMNPYLVRPARFKTAFDKARYGSVIFKHLVMRQRCLAAARNHRHFLARARMAAYRPLDLSGSRAWQAPDERLIYAAEAPVGELAR